MKTFNDQDLLLSNDTARHLFHDLAEDLPIIDYHCHLDPKEIYENKPYRSITELWLAHDHYKWRLMRSCGVNEDYITGDSDDREKFRKWAACLPTAIGNPLYHWSHLELKKYFGYEGVLNATTADEVYDLCNAMLDQLTPRALITGSKVEALCTTDDPTDSLEWHRKLKEEDFEVKVLPTWRPDKAMNLTSPWFPDYVEELSKATDLPIESWSDLLSALHERMNHFAEHGCRLSDHGLDVIPFEDATPEELEAIFHKRMEHIAINAHEERQYRTAFLLAMGKECADRDWTMQLHFGVQRNVNNVLFRYFGPDAGVDAISDRQSAKDLGKFLNELNVRGNLPRTILYSLNPEDNAMIGTIIGCFQDSSARGKLQHGSAWWFNDNKTGMQAQMTSLANLGALGTFVGMLTDSRSFLSYARHEYFRRILCDMIGTWIENGEYPNDEAQLKTLITDICVNNARTYFKF